MHLYKKAFCLEYEISETFLNCSSSAKEPIASGSFEFGEPRDVTPEADQALFIRRSRINPAACRNSRRAG